MSFSDADVQRLTEVIAAAVRATMTAAVQTPGGMTDGGGGQKREYKVLEERSFRRMEKFAGGE